MGATGHNAPTWMGVSMRTVSLVALTFQFSAFVLLLHYSRIMPTDDGHRYLPSTAVFLVELLKLALCLTVALFQVSTSIPRSMPSTSLLGAVSHAVFSGDSWKMAIPAGLYTLANSMQYVGISNLDAATYQVLYQLKIIFTAVFSVTVLRKTISPSQWIALVLLMVGVATVSFSEDALASNHHTRVYVPGSTDLKRHLLGILQPAGTLSKRSATYEGIQEDELALDGAVADSSLGLAAVLGVCVTSGFAGVYFEKLLKESPKPASLWIRNVQMSLYSLFPAFFIGVLFIDGETVARYGFFDGYNYVVVLSIIVQAFGGIIVAFCIYYADNISKNFAVSISMVLSSLASFGFLGFTPSPNFLVGTVIVLGATYLYAIQRPSQARPPPIRIHSYEKTMIDAPDGYADASVTLPKTPLKAEDRVSSSRPASPGNKKRKNEGLEYFTKVHD